MKVLVYGANGWIGQMFQSNTKHDVIIGKARPDDYSAALEEITSIKPDSVCSFLGRTHGPGVPNIDYLEQTGRLYENMRDNFLAPIHLAQICDSLAIHYAYLGTGCIYTYTEDKKIFSEDDKPNFFGSSYSIMKGHTDQEMRRYNTTLQLRIRMPISSEKSSRNFIDKIVSYKNICSTPNSMTVLDDMWPILDKMIDLRTVGTFNMTNPGVIEHNWILEQYRQLCDPAHSWTSVTYDQQMQFIKSHRSNNEMTTAKLEAFCAENGLQIPEIHDSVMRCIRARVVPN